MTKSGYRPKVTVVKRRRIYAGMSNQSTSQRKMTPASLYTHYIDGNPDSPTFGQRLEIPRVNAA